MKHTITQTGMLYVFSPPVSESSVRRWFLFIPYIHKYTKFNPMVLQFPYKNLKIPPLGTQYL